MAIERAKLQLRCGSTDMWTTTNPVLLIGEPGFDYNKGIIKIGDGGTAWNDLPSIGAGGGGDASSEELLAAYFTANSSANIDIDWYLQPFGYISQSTKEFTPVPSGFVNTGYVYLKGLSRIDYTLRATGDNIMVAFYNKDKNLLSDLTIDTTNTIISGSIDLTDSRYDDAYYAFFSSTDAYSTFVPKVSLNGLAEFRDMLHKSDVVSKIGINRFDPSTCTAHEVLTTSGTVDYADDSMLSPIYEHTGDDYIWIKGLPTYNLPSGSLRLCTLYAADMSVRYVAEIRSNGSDFRINSWTHEDGLPDGKCKYFRFTVYANPDTPIDINNCQIMLSNTDDAYIPFKKEIVSIDGAVLPGVDNDFNEAVLTGVQCANQIALADVEFSKNGYIDAATHNYVEDASGAYKCSGFINVRGANTIEFSARAAAPEEGAPVTSAQMVFYDKNRSAITSLDIVVNDGITRTIDLTNSDYTNVYYIVCSNYEPGWASKKYLKIKGKVDLSKQYYDQSSCTYVSGYNMFDINSIEMGVGINSSGVYGPDSQSICSNLMEIPADRGRTGSIFFLNLPPTDYTKRFIEYDENMNIVLGPSDIDPSVTSKEVSLRDNCKYVRFTLMRAVSPLPSEAEVKEDYKDVMVTVQYSMTEYQPYHKEVASIGGFKFAAATVSEMYRGKTWAVVGDSLTEKNERSTKFYYDYVAEQLGFTVINQGDSGTGYYSASEVGRAFYQRLDVGTPGTAGHLDPLSGEEDVVTVFGSFNDLSAAYVSGIALGNIYDTLSSGTICGYINETIRVIYSKNCATKLGIIAPCPWKELHPGVTEADEYVEALRKICAKNSIPFLDLYHNSGLRPWEADVRAELYDKDAKDEHGDPHGTHPNQKGHELLASKIREFVKTLI